MKNDITVPEGMFRKAKEGKEVRKRFVRMLKRMPASIQCGSVFPLVVVTRNESWPRV